MVKTLDVAYQHTVLWIHVGQFDRFVRMSSEENPTNERESSKNPLCRDKLQWILSIVNACPWEVVIKIIDALYLLWEIDRGKLNQKGIDSVISG